MKVPRSISNSSYILPSTSIAPTNFPAFSTPGLMAPASALQSNSPISSVTTPTFLCSTSTTYPTPFSNAPITSAMPSVSPNDFDVFSQFLDYFNEDDFLPSKTQSMDSEKPVYSFTPLYMLMETFDGTTTIDENPLE